MDRRKTVVMFRERLSEVIGRSGLRTFLCPPSDAYRA